MEQDQDWLKELVARRTREMWATEQRPYYISFVANDTAKEGVDYKQIIAPLKLRQWALTAEIDGVKALAHPLHKAKVGFVPTEEDYPFTDGAEAAADAEGKPKPPPAKPFVATRRPTLQFLEALSTLSNDELDNVNIPVRTIVRLLHG